MFPETKSGETSVFNSLQRPSNPCPQRRQCNTLSWEQVNLLSSFVPVKGNDDSLKAEVSLLLRSLGGRVRENRPLPWVETCFDTTAVHNPWTALFTLQTTCPMICLLAVT